ncbi:MAG: phosphatidate cytidylyltransferase [Acetobacteraceae bacterium]
MHALGEAMGGRFEDLPARLVSAFVLAAIALACLWAGGISWALLVAVAGIGVGVEWARVAGFRPAALPGLCLPVLAAAACLATAAGITVPTLILLAVVAAALARTGQAYSPGRVWLAGGVFYVGIAGMAATWLRLGTPAGRSNLLFVLVIVWASDTGAYLVGRMVGGPKLAPRISPSKTWAGMAGGIAFAIAAGLVVGKFFAAGTNVAGIGISIALAVASQAGDLLESAFKRRFGVKDSSRLIPGHGGLLDRLDGVLAAFPMAAIMMLALGPGADLWR